VCNVWLSALVLNRVKIQVSQTMKGLKLVLVLIIGTAVTATLGIAPAQAGKLTYRQWQDECTAAGGTISQHSYHAACVNGEGRVIVIRGRNTGWPFAGGAPNDSVNINGDHDTQGPTDPFLGVFRTNTPISSLLNGQSSQLNLSLDVNASRIELFGPEIWGEPTVTPNLIDGRISIERDSVSGNFTISDYFINFDSFPINGIESGINTISTYTSQFDFNLSTGEINAYSEERLTNNLYPSSNPILSFSHTLGKIVSDYEIQVFSDNSPFIVPGVPGQPPSYPLGMAYIATIASFDSNTGLVTFADNLGNGLISDVSIVSSPEGIYYSSPTDSEALVGARFNIEPFSFLGVDMINSYPRYIFSDARFSLFNSDGIFASGILKNISIETYSFGFTGDVVLDNINFLSSPFIDRWRSNPTIQLLGSLASSKLITSTIDFTQNGTSGIDFTNLEPVPEPTSTLSLLALGTLGAASTIKRKLKSSQSTEKETTKVG